LSSVDPGFDAAGVVSARYQLPASRYPAAPDTPGWPDIPATNDFHQALQSRLHAIPGVEAAAIASPHPLDPGFTNSFVIVGREVESTDYPEIRTRWVSPGYFQTLDVPLLSGRSIMDGDVATSPPVTLINRTAAERFFPDVDPVGQELRWWGITRRVVGVVGDERFLGLAAAPAPAAYVPVAQGAVGQATLLVRTSAGPSTIVPAIRDELANLDPEVPLFDTAPLQSALAESISSPRFTAVLLASFAGLALLLALVGVHGVLSYAAARRAPEVGIRMALGATRGSVVREIVVNGLRLAGIGVVLGALGALAASRLLRSLVYAVSPVDPATYAVVIGSVLAAALLASLLPALRASGADPSATLRAE
jgi:putative ABC transport system permease protein